MRGFYFTTMALFFLVIPGAVRASDLPPKVPVECLNWINVTGPEKIPSVKPSLPWNPPPTPSCGRKYQEVMAWQHRNDKERKEFERLEQKRKILEKRRARQKERARKAEGK